MPLPDDDSPTADTAADETDIAYQDGLDCAIGHRQWIDSALAVLTAEFDAGDDRGGRAGMVRDAIRDLRVAAAGRAARAFRSDIEPPGA